MDATHETGAPPEKVALVPFLTWKSKDILGLQIFLPDLLVSTFFDSNEAFAFPEKGEGEDSKKEKAHNEEKDEYKIIPINQTHYSRDNFIESPDTPRCYFHQHRARG